MGKHKLLPWFFFPMAVLVLSSCMTTYRSLPDPFRIKDFPTPPHNRQIEVVEEKDLTPDRPYIQTHSFEVNHFPDAPKRFQIGNLLEMARGSGVDALVIISHRNEWVSLPFGRVSYQNVMRAKGIKFKQNVDYLHLFPYIVQLYVFNNETDSFDLIANLTPDFDGQIVSVEDLADGRGNHYYRNFIRLYSLDFLLADESESWRFRRSPIGLVTRRAFYADGRRTIELNIKYEPPRKVTVIEGKFLTGENIWQEKVFRLTYGANRLIEEKTILINGQPSLIERFHYDAKNRLITSVYYKIENDREIPFLKTQHHYFENRDVFERF